MNAKFTCHEKMCNEYNSCKVRKSIGLACMLSGLDITTEGWGCSSETTEINSHISHCNKKCEKKRLVCGLIEKHNKFMKLGITECSNWKKCRDECIVLRKKN